MGFYTILQALEGFILELAVWAFFAPKTLWKVIVDPAWVQPYVKNEWKKPDEKRFQEYVSPLVCWILLGVMIPYAMISNGEFKYNLAIELSHRVLEFLSNKDLLPGMIFKGDVYFTKMKILAASTPFFALLGPFAFTTLMVWCGSDKRTIEDFKRIFFTQCFAFTIFSFIFFLVYPLIHLFLFVIFHTVRGDLNNWDDLITIIILLISLWPVEREIFQREKSDFSERQKKIFPKAIIFYSASLFVALFLFCVLGFVFLMILGAVVVKTA
jgi:hypothetical protein